MADGVFIKGLRTSGRGEPTTIVDPATDMPCRSLVHASEADVDDAVAAAEAAGLEWSSRTSGERARVLLRWADLIEADASMLSDMEVAETGKPSTVVHDGEIPFAVDNLRYLAGAARSLEGSGAGILNPGFTSMILHRPRGVVASVAPWNFPLIMAIWKIAPAVAMGNTVVLKPSPQTPGTSLRLAELATEAGFPDGVVNVVTGGEQVGKRLVQDRRVAMASITGSTRAGREVMAAASATPVPVHLELGGKAAALVFADADVTAAAHGLAMAGTYNTGQDCTAAARIYVHSSVLERFRDVLIGMLERIRWGDPTSTSTDIGPLITRAHRERVHSYVARASADGARLLVGGFVPDGPGAFYPPTLLDHVPQSAEIMQEEVFGPVLVLSSFEDEDGAVALANDSAYGLASSVWTSDVARALSVSHRLKAGVTWVNDHLPMASEAPHGGVKGSGFGKDLGQESLMEYSVTQHVMVRHGRVAVHDSFRPA